MSSDSSGCAAPDVADSWYRSPGVSPDGPDLRVLPDAPKGVNAATYIGVVPDSPEGADGGNVIPDVPGAPDEENVGTKGNDLSGGPGGSDVGAESSRLNNDSERVIAAARSSFKLSAADGTVKWRATWAAISDAPNPPMGQALGL